MDGLEMKNCDNFLTIVYEKCKVDTVEKLQSNSDSEQFK